MSPITQTPIPLSDEWSTPQWLFDHFDAEFHFTLDAAAKPWNAKCEQFFDGTGLGNSWKGATVWLNPPYSDIDAWLAKARKAVRLGGATVVALVPCTPDRKWWNEHVEDEASEVRLLTRSLLPSGRVHFEKEDGTSGRAPFASCVVIYKRPWHLRGLTTTESEDRDRCGAFGTTTGAQCTLENDHGGEHRLET